MKPLLINTFEQTGGAAKAAYRLLCGLRREGVLAQMLVRGKTGRDVDVVKCEPDWLGWCKGWFDILPVKCYPRRQPDNFNPALVPDRLKASISELAPDLLHLHWVSYGFLRIETLAALGLPIVWTLHDAWPFSGGCHLPGGCRKYEWECGECPVLGSAELEDLSRRVWKRKQRSYCNARMTFVAPSRWMAERARASGLLRERVVEVIPNGIDMEKYSPGDSLAARDRLGLPRKRRLILFGARHALSDRNKGAAELCAALGQLPVELREQSTLVLFGETARAPLSDFNMEVVNRGEISDEAEIVDLYRAADLLVVCSREENLPNMISEALACGLPCAAFNVGGIADQVIHRQTGCLAPASDAGALAIEIAWLLEHAGPQSSLALNARQHAAANFSLEQVARRHLELYRRSVEPIRSF
jgi:glycosyltransferase involved in cell wall biosynthesis